MEYVIQFAFIVVGRLGHNVKCKHRRRDFLRHTVILRVTTEKKLEKSEFPGQRGDRNVSSRSRSILSALHVPGEVGGCSI
jgi:hypothetical protein